MQNFRRTLVEEGIQFNIRFDDNFQFFTNKLSETESKSGI